MAESLLQTKLYVPNIPTGFVFRPALNEKLTSILHKKLCLIMTPAGYGKTTSIVSWASQREQPLAWLSLDEGDNHFVRFFAYLVRALQKVLPGFGEGLFEKLTSPQGIPHEFFLMYLVNELDGADRDCVLVLDDFHTIHNVEIHESIEYLLDNLPSRIHLAITSRAAMPFPVTNLRAKGQLIEIRYSDLKFTIPDAHQYLNQRMHLSLSEQEIQDLVEYTEGWIVGLHLAALALASTDKTLAFLAKLKTASQFITDYLFDQVFQVQPQDLQDFLLASAALKCFTASLCDAVLEVNRSAEWIAQVERLNLFIIRLDSQQEWFRYHHLFSELLFNRSKARRDKPQLVHIWERASRWSEGQGLLEDAVEYAIQAADFERAAGLVERIRAAALWTSNVERLLSWLEAFPEEIYYHHPTLWLLHLWSHINLAQFSLAASDLESTQIKSIAQHIENDEKKSLFESSVATIQALIAINLHYDIPAGKEYARTGLPSREAADESAVMAPMIYGKACMLTGDLETARDLLEQSSTQVDKTRGTFMKMIIAHHRSELSFFQGDLRKTEELLKAAYQLAIENHLDDASAFFRICIDIGRVHYEKNNLTSARQFLSTGVQGGGRWLIAYDLLDGYCAMLDLALLERNYAAAEDMILRVEYLGEKCGFPQPILDRAEAMRTRLAIRRSDWRVVRQWLNRKDSSAAAGFEFYRRYEKHTTIQAHTAVREYSQAKEILTSILLASEQGQWLREIAHCRSWLALLLYQEGSRQAALAQLREASTYALHQGYVRTIVDAGEAIREPLRKLHDELRMEKGQEALRLYTQKLSEALDTTPASQPAWFAWPGSDLPEPLTDREARVLELLAQGHSNQEIASLIYVSPSTVKFHLKNIYLKLGAHTRTQALARAGEIGLV